LHDRSDLIWHLRVMPRDGLQVTQREHEAVLKAIVRKDAAAARDTMQAHLMSLYQRVLAASVQAQPSMPAPAVLPLTLMSPRMTSPS
jgi:DNA-binding GntR family transcriptional regulator